MRAPACPYLPWFASPQLSAVDGETCEGVDREGDCLLVGNFFVFWLTSFSTFTSFGVLWFSEFCCVWVLNLWCEFLTIFRKNGG